MTVKTSAARSEVAGDKPLDSNEFKRPVANVTNEESVTRTDTEQFFTSSTSVEQ